METDQVSAYLAGRKAKTNKSEAGNKTETKVRIVQVSSTNPNAGVSMLGSVCSHEAGGRESWLQWIAILLRTPG